MSRMPTVYVPHGGGPCFFMEWDPPETWRKMQDFLQQLPSMLPERPRAMLVISAHWEEQDFAVTGTAAPELIYDYYGFPEHTYRITYPAHGAPDLAQRVTRLLHASGIATHIDTERGFDHGVFIPLKLVYPDADIPIVQLSLKAGLDPAQHIAAGQALAPLRDEGILIVGSGMSYHNLRAFMRGTPDAAQASEAFGAWLDGAATAAARNEMLAAWAAAPAARAAHPREEHLLPLMVAAGAAEGDAGRIIYSDQVMNAALSAYGFGFPAA